MWLVYFVVEKFRPDFARKERGACRRTIRPQTSMFFSECLFRVRTSKFLDHFFELAIHFCRVGANAVVGRANGTAYAPAFERDIDEVMWPEDKPDRFYSAGLIALDFGFLDSHLSVVHLHQPF